MAENNVFVERKKLYIRPRRFGKSLTLSMLQHYYDINDADKFDMLYKGLYIGDHPTPERNSYLVIKLNFAVVNAELNNYRKALDAHCTNAFNYFCDVYAQYLPDGMKEKLNKKNGAVDQLIRRDNNYAYYASVINNLVNDGFITGNLKTGFPAETICAPDNFISLLYYYGILTIDGTYMGMIKFIVPNEVVKEQIHSYMGDA